MKGVFAVTFVIVMVFSGSARSQTPDEGQEEPQEGAAPLEADPSKTQEAEGAAQSEGSGSSSTSSPEGSFRTLEGTVTPDGVSPRETREAPDAKDGEGDGKKKKKDKKNKKGPLQVRAKIHTRWEMEHYRNEVLDPLTLEMTEESVNSNEFKIQRARVKLIWDLSDWMMATLQLGSFDETTSLMSILKDAYIHLSPLRYLQLRVGQFKKPFSRFELRGFGTLRLPHRGVGNELIVESFDSNGTSGDSLQYGDRDLGLQLSGRLVKKLKLDYEVGVFNGTGPVTPEELKRRRSKDVVARMKIKPAKWIGVGVNGSFKFFDKDERTREIADPDDDGEGITQKVLRHPGWAAGLDMLFKVAGFRLHLESLLARDYRNPVHLRDPETYDGVSEFDDNNLILNWFAVLSYRYDFEVDWKLAVEPVFKMEMLDPNTMYDEDLVFLYTPGLNMYFGKHFRLMVHGNFQRVSKYTLESYSGSIRSYEQLIVQFCFDFNK